MTVDRKKVTGRRELHFGSVGDILRDVESLTGREINALGNWTPAQVVQHLNRMFRMSLDGVNYRAPWFVRTIAKLGKKRWLTKTLNPGFNLPPQMSFLQPDANITWDEAVSQLRSSIEQIERGRRMGKPSPAFGTLTHEEWEQLQCRHAEMHLSFLVPR